MTYLEMKKCFQAIGDNSGLNKIARFEALCKQIYERYYDSLQNRKAIPQEEFIDLLGELHKAHEKALSAIRVAGNPKRTANKIYSCSYLTKTEFEDIIMTVDTECFYASVQLVVILENHRIDVIGKGNIFISSGLVRRGDDFNQPLREDIRTLAEINGYPFLGKFIQVCAHDPDDPNSSFSDRHITGLRFIGDNSNVHRFSAFRNLIAIKDLPIGVVTGIKEGEMVKYTETINISQMHFGPTTWRNLDPNGIPDSNTEAVVLRIHWELRANQLESRYHESRYLGAGRFEEVVNKLIAE